MSSGNLTGIGSHAQLLPRLCPLIERLSNLQLAILPSGEAGVVGERHFEEIRYGLIDLAHSARVAGLSTYCSLSLQALEQLTPNLQSGYIPIQVLRVFTAWIDLSIKYLLNARYSCALVENASDHRWERPVQKAYRNVLLGGLQDERANVERQQMRHSRLMILNCLTPKSTNDALR